MVFINVLIVGAAPHFVFPRCLNTSDDFLYPACRGQGKTELALTTDNCIRPAHIRRSLLLLYILRPACGTDGFSSRAFVDVTALCAPVPVPFQFIHLKVRGTANRTHTASPHIPPYCSYLKNMILQPSHALGMGIFINKLSGKYAFPCLNQ
jgi:hypothetical protein